MTNLDLDLVLLFQAERRVTSCLHLARSLAVTPVHTHLFQIFFQCLPCSLWSSKPPSAIFWSPFQSQTNWSGCRESNGKSRPNSNRQGAVIRHGWRLRRLNCCDCENFTRVRIGRLVLISFINNL